MRNRLKNYESRIEIQGHAAEDIKTFLTGKRDFLLPLSGEP